MRYDEIRQQVQHHFRGLLEQFRNEIDAAGPPEDRELLRMTEAAKFHSRWSWDDYVNIMGAEHAADTISDACARLGIQEDRLTAGGRQQLQRDILNGHAACLTERLNYIDGLNQISLNSEPGTSKRPDDQNAAAPASST